jgi:O-acetyl-ADP-ribose deacetylase (regulator of RNase III)
MKACSSSKPELAEALIALLLGDMPEYREAAARVPEAGRRGLLRSLMNLRPPRPLAAEYLALQDELLGRERDERGIVDPRGLPASGDGRMVLWQGDITRLASDAIVNAANSQMLGCFHPCHGCIDNAIHSAAGLQLREECAALMRSQGQPEPVGSAKATKAYNLPSRQVLHTVGPMVRGTLGAGDRAALASCYASCLDAAAGLGLRSIAFCCVSTGEYGFPAREAAAIAVAAVRAWLREDRGIERVVFDVFKDSDRALYESELEAP